MGIIIFIVSLAILVLVHEFGHFIVAKKAAIRVDEFGIGFPPRVWGKKMGETVYSVNWIPFGGFVKIFGEDPILEISEEHKPKSFYHKPRWIQALVLVAGVAMNIIFAWLLISLGYMIGLPAPAGPGVSGPHLVITEILPNSPAEKAGLQVGDTIDGNVTPESFRNLVSQSQHVVISYHYGNSGEKTVTVTPDTTTVPGQRAIGIAMDEIGTLKLSIPTALIEGVKTTWFLTENTAIGLGQFLWGIVTFHSDFSQVAGPVGIAGTVSSAASLGFVYVLSLVALISINLAIINLVPFPALDGGRLLFVVIEAVIRRPISPKVVQWANSVGFALLIILMVIVTTHDILKLL